MRATASRLRAWRLCTGLFVSGLIVASCVLGEFELDGKACPCVDGYVCDTSRNVCVPGSAGTTSGTGTAAGGSTPTGTETGTVTGSGTGGSGASGPEPWVEQDSGTTVELLAIWGSGPADVYVVGEDGTILHYDGSSPWTLQPQPLGGSVTLRGVSGSASEGIFVVGDGGLILHSTGDGSWTQQTSPTPNDLYAVWVAADDYAYAVGADSAALYREPGQPWSAQQFGSLGPNVTLTGVWAAAGGPLLMVGEQRRLRCDGLPCTFPNAHVVDGQGRIGTWGMSNTNRYIVGTTGYIEHSAMLGTWTPQQSNTSLDLHHVWGYSGGDIYVVGDGGVILHSNGDGSWQQLANDNTSLLYGVWGSSQDDVYAVGANGTILHKP